MCLSLCSYWDAGVVFMTAGSVGHHRRDEIPRPGLAAPQGEYGAFPVLTCGCERLLLWLGPSKPPSILFFFFHDFCYCFNLRCQS